MNPTPAAERPPSPGNAAGTEIHDLDGQRLRILRCTAHAMATSPGGLRFKRGSRPWLDDLPACQPVAAGNRKPRGPNAGPRSGAA